MYLSVISSLLTKVLKPLVECKFIRVHCNYAANDAENINKKRNFKVILKITDENDEFLI